MSHLAHIVKLKENLIQLGVTSPQVQTNIAQTAYTKALINVNGSNKLDEKTCIEFNRYILSYWNEVTPVKGNLIASQVGSFFRSMDALFNTTIVDDVALIRIVPGVEEVGDVKYTELETYSSLVQVLIDEANHKLPQFTSTNQIA